MASNIVYQPLRRTAEVVTPAHIDIDEPIRLIRGEPKFVRFEYSPGDPPGDRFGMEFYLLETYADQGINKLSEDLPDYTITPRYPIPIVAENLEGSVRFFVPTDWSYTIIYAKIILYQQGIQRLTPVGEQDRQEFAPGQASQKRDVFSNWRRK